MCAKHMFVTGMFDIPDFSWYDYHQLRNIDIVIRTGLFLRYNGSRIKSQIDTHFRDHDIIMIGHSYGCFIISEYLRSCNPHILQRVKGVVLLNSALKGKHLSYIQSLYPLMIQPSLYTLAFLANKLFQVKIQQGLKYSDWNYTNTCIPDLDNYSEQRGTYFIDFCSEKKIPVLNICTSLYQFNIFNIVFPSINNTCLDLILWPIVACVIDKALWKKHNDLILRENEQWLPESPYATNISLKASHLTSIGLKVGCLGGRTDDTDNIDDKIEQFCKRIYMASRTSTQ